MINKPQKPTLIKDLGVIFPNEASKHKSRYGIYKCECGNKFKTRIQSVMQGRTLSCGCHHKKISSKTHSTHGLSGHKLYCVWVSQKTRCKCKVNKSYKDYGERGIGISKEFEQFPIWLEYIESLRNANKINYSIDRINNNIGYERGNLRWASKATQSRNRRKQKNNTSGYTGVYLCRATNKWFAKIKVNRKQIYLGRFYIKLSAALAYDQYIIDNKLEHTTNGKGF